MLALDAGADVDRIDEHVDRARRRSEDGGLDLIYLPILNTSTCGLPVIWEEFATSFGAS